MSNLVVLFLLSLWHLFAFIECVDSNNTSTPIKIFKVIQGNELGEGDGAKVLRTIGNEIRSLDPFLLFDLAIVKLPGGFPDHPHRGFETITYVISGTIFHEDFKGHKGEIGPGDVQWMTAGKGIVHAEIPSSFEELSVAFQLWINLKSVDKMIEPNYQEIKSENIPVYLDEKTRSTVKIISGAYEGLLGPCKSRTPVIYFDVTVPESEVYSMNIDTSFNGFIFLYEGEVTINDNWALNTFDSAVFYKDNGNILTVRTKKESKFIVVAGEPLNEPIVQYGPFVMNTKEEIYNAMEDYNYGRNGFEKATTWSSQIKHLKNRKNEKRKIDEQTKGNGENEGQTKGDL